MILIVEVAATDRNSSVDNGKLMYCWSVLNTKVLT